MNPLAFPNQKMNLKSDFVSVSISNGFGVMLEFILVPFWYIFGWISCSGGPCVFDDHSMRNQCFWVQKSIQKWEKWLRISTWILDQCFARKFTKIWSKRCRKSIKIPSKTDSKNLCIFGRRRIVVGPFGTIGVPQRQQGIMTAVDGWPIDAMLLVSSSVRLAFDYVCLLRLWHDRKIPMQMLVNDVCMPSQPYTCTHTSSACTTHTS